MKYGKNNGFKVTRSQEPWLE